MKFSAKGKVDAGSIVTVDISALAQPVTVRCKVMWCREATSFFEQGFHFGVMFQDLSVQDQFRLRELIQERGG